MFYNIVFYHSDLINDHLSVKISFFVGEIPEFPNSFGSLIVVCL